VKTLVRTSMIACMALAIVFMTVPLGYTQEVTTPKAIGAKCGVVRTIDQCSYDSGFDADSNAANVMFKWGPITSETLDLLGRPVYNLRGQTMGIITAFVVDSRGRIAFAILWQAPPEIIHAGRGRYVPVPFSALSIRRMGRAEVAVVLNIEKGAMDSAPSFDGTNDLNNIQCSARIYRHFGHTPYWTEEEAGKARLATNSLDLGHNHPY
jgi:hypothetical protein